MPNPVRNGYEDVDTLKNAGGVVAVITRRTGSHLHTVSFFKEYERDGDQARTSFFSRKALADLRQMIDTADKELERRESAAKASLGR